MFTRRKFPLHLGSYLLASGISDTIAGEFACAGSQASLRFWSAAACGGVLGLRSECGRSLMWEGERRGLLTLDELQLLLLGLGETGNPVSAAESTLMDHGPCAPLIPRLCFCF
jgi:hypothetical protein